MKITDKKITIAPENEVLWSDVQELKVLGTALVLELVNGSLLRVENLSGLMIDQAFRCFEGYLNKNPRKKSKKHQKA